MHNQKPVDPIAARLPVVEWLHGIASEHGVPYLNSVVLELLRSHTDQMIVALQKVSMDVLVSIVEHNLIPKSVVVQAFAKARAQQRPEVTAVADEVLAGVGQELKEFREVLAEVDEKLEEFREQLGGE